MPTITVRLPIETVKKIDALALEEAARTGLKVDRSAIVRRALTEEAKKLRGVTYGDRA